MNKILATLALALALLAGGCKVMPAEESEPLVLPYPLYEQDYRGNQVTVTLQALPGGPAPYGFHMAVHTAEGQTRFGVYVITVVLTEGYRQGRAVDWSERIADQKGSGGLWEGEGLSAQEVTAMVDYGLGASADHPVAVFVRLVAADPADPATSHEQTDGPVAVLQILPDDQGVVRLDQ
ncbi:MAG: hypothetical protein ACOYZ7_16000 [Chloroflexota bacterium]